MAQLLQPINTAQTRAKILRTIRQPYFSCPNRRSNLKPSLCQTNPGLTSQANKGESSAPTDTALTFSPHFLLRCRGRPFILPAEFPHSLPTAQYLHSLPMVQYLHSLPTAQYLHSLPMVRLPHSLPTARLPHSLPTAQHLPTVSLAQVYRHSLPAGGSLVPSSGR